MRSPEKIYSLAKKGKSIRGGPDVPPIASDSVIYLAPDKSMEFGLILQPRYQGNILPIEQMLSDDRFKDGLERTFRTNISDDLRIKGGNFYRVHAGEDGQEVLEQLVGLNISSPTLFKFSPQDTQIESSEQFQKELKLGLDIFQIYTSELYKSLGIQLPPTKLIITPPMQVEPESPLDVFKAKGGELETLRQSIVIEDRPNVSFEQIGGQSQAVKSAQELALQLAHPEAFLEEGTDVPKGILFYGEPGNGKTLIAKALANSANAAFVNVKARDIASKWFGDPEKLAHGIFEIAREEAAKHNGHAIIFLDEVDSLIPSRTNGVHEATRKVIGTFLTDIDGLDTKEGITVIASTNTPEAVDGAFLSRMTEWVEVPNPTQEGIAQIFQIHFSQASKKANKELLTEGLNFMEVAKGLDGISGRDIYSIVQTVLKKRGVRKVHGEDLTNVKVTTDDIKDAINESAKVREAQKKARKGHMGFR